MALKSLIKTGDKVKILYQVVDGCLPAFRHAHKNDAGYDLYSTENAWIRSGETRAIMTNARVCIPPGYMGRVTGRSSTATRGLLCHTGTVDAGYTGPIYAILSNLNHHMVEVKRGDRVAQLVILELPEVEMSEGKLPETERGNQGLGSTGR